MKRVINAAPLGHRRRNERLFDVVAWLSRRLRGGGGQPTALAAWALAMGAWRFFHNEAIALVAAYDVVRAGVRAALGPVGACFVVHDVSLLDFSGHHAKRDRRPIGNHVGLGYELYSALVLTANGRPVGPVFQELRGAAGCQSSEPLATATERRRGVARFVGHIEQMEKAVRAVARHLQGWAVIHLADREFDDLLAQRGWHAAGVAYIVRVQHLTRRAATPAGARTNVGAAVAATPLRRGGIVTRDGVAYRRWIGETTVVLDGRARRGRHRGEPTRSGAPITVRLVVAELRARGRDTVRWVLVTNTALTAAAVVDAYVARWRIERYFFLAKVGYALETWTQQDPTAFARRLAVTALAALCVYNLLALVDDGDAAARDAVQTVAAMGGWLGRKRDPIGPLVLVRGMRALLDATALIQHLGPDRVLAMTEQIMPGFRASRAGMRRRNAADDV